jgi:hypothetical protein
MKTAIPGSQQYTKAIGGLGSFGSLQPTSTQTWSSKSGLPMPKGFSGLLSSQTGMIPGGGVTPSLYDYQMGIMRDLAASEKLYQQNFDRSQKEIENYRKSVADASKRMYDPKTDTFAGQKFFDEARGFQQQALKDQQESDKALQAQLAAGGRRLDQAANQVSGAYGAATRQIDEGRDRIASDMAAGMRQNAELQGQNEFGGMLGLLEGSEGQVAEAQRLYDAEIQRGVGQNVSAIQFAGAQQKAAIQQSRAQAIQGMALGRAEYDRNVAMFGQNSAQARQSIYKMGADLAMANSAFYQNQMSLLNQLEVNGARAVHDLVKSNPIMGVMWGDALLELGKASALSGKGSIHTGPRNPNTITILHG